MYNEIFGYLIFIACFAPQSVLVKILANKTDEYKKGKTSFEDVAQFSITLYLHHIVSDIKDPEDREKRLREKFSEASSMVNLMSFERQ